MAAGKALIVAAIDFGTTYSGWAFSFKNEFESDPTKVSTKIWRESSLLSHKGPTCILIKPDGRTLEKFGYEAETYYSDLCTKGKQSEYYYFYRFKMMLWDKELTTHTQVEDACGKTLQALLVFSLSIRYMKDEMIRSSNNQLGEGTIKESDFHWVLTVPAIWNDKAKHFMRLAAEQAGIDGAHLSIALEPEVASLFCKHLRVDKETLTDNTLSAFREGKTYLVLDAGGGTVDITVHEVCHGGGLKEVYKASGGAWGGTKVDEAFIKFLEDIVGEDVIRCLKEDDMDDYLELLKNFEMKKRTIDAVSDDLVTYKVPFKMLEVVPEMKSASLKKVIKASKYSEQVDLSGDKMRLSANLFRSFFDTSINSIIQHVEDLLQKPENSGVEAILMVGGYSESPLLQETIRQKFNNLRIIIPNEAGLAVLKGAVFFGHDPIVIRERVAKFTYGTDIRGKEIYPGIYGDKRFDKLITNGQTLVVGEPQQEKTYCPTEEDQTALWMNIYVTRDKDPTYVTDLGCQKIGSFIVPVSGRGLDRKVTARMIFGGTEIEIVCIEQSTGKETKSRIDFLQ